MMAIIERILETRPTKVSHQEEDIDNSDLKLNRIFGVAKCRSVDDQGELSTATLPRPP